VEQVQQIVRIANKYKIPLYAISTGRNLGYGGSAPTLTGSVIVDLKRMNRVLEVNEAEAYMVVEPGASFMDVYAQLESIDHRLMISPPEPGWGSPIGNALDHGVGGVAGDNFSMVVGLEVVLPTGELMRTGMGAAPTSRLWQNYRYGFGPYIDGIFSQSNFGIVTKAGFSLVRQPEMQGSFAVSSYRNEDLHRMIEIAQRLRDLGVVFTTTANSPIRSANNHSDGGTSRNIAEVRTLLHRPDGGADSAWEALAREQKIPIGVVTGSARGPRRMVEAAMEQAREEFSAIQGAEFRVMPPLSFPVKKEDIDDEQRSFIGIPNLWAFSRMAIQGTSKGHYYFSPVIKATAEDMFAANAVVRDILLKAGDDDLTDRFGWRGGLGSYNKSFVMLYEFLITEDVALNRRRRDIFKQLVEACGAHGWCEYRTPPAFQDLVMEQYSFNNHALRRFHETVKDAIDPNGILAPGKSGIWPKRLRKA